MRKFLISFLVMSTMSVFAQNVVIPDVNFKAKLIQLGVDKNNDGEIQESEAQLIIDGLYIDNLKISNLKGIEAFINLTSLDVSNNQLTSLDVSKNVKLESLICYSNQLTMLDLTNNPKLLSIACFLNKITNLNVSNNLQLQWFRCSNNELKSLDVSKNEKLYHLSCSNNELTSLDVSKNNQLSELECINNPDLKTICVSSLENVKQISFTKDDATQFVTCTITATSELSQQNLVVVKAYNLQGREVSVDTKNELIILLYNNGMTEKVIQQ